MPESKLYFPCKHANHFAIQGKCENKVRTSLLSGLLPGPLLSFHLNHILCLRKDSTLVQKPRNLSFKPRIS